MSQRAERPLWVRLAELVPTPWRTPFTFGYLVVLSGTTILVRWGDPVVTTRLLALSSTNAHNLTHRPFPALFASALWFDSNGNDWVAMIAIFAIMAAPLERRLGTACTAAVFFTGHILVTLLTEVPIMVAINIGALPASNGDWLDVGVSYGYFTTGGTMAFLLTRRRRLWAVLALETFIVVTYIAEDDPGPVLSMITLIGHIVSAHFGLLCCGPWLHRRTARLRHRVL